MTETTDRLLDEIARLLALGIRQTMETQTEAILAFDQSGLASSRIAELLGTTPATVRATKQKASKRSAATTSAESAT